MNRSMTFMTLMLAMSTPLHAFTEIVSFGDSLSDVGNIASETFSVYPGPGYDGGRFSSGPVWVEQLGQRYQLQPETHSTAGGSNYAYGGTTTGNDFYIVDYLFFHFEFPNAGSQITRYLDTNPTISDDTLFTLWAGGNDLFDISGTLAADGADTVDTMLVNMTDHITRLAQAGAQHIVLPNLPPLGQTPSIGGGTQLIDRYVNQYNARLSALTTSLTASLGVHLYPVDTFALSQMWDADPARFGWSNTTDAYLDSSQTLDPDAYVFFDDIHPTGKGHNLIAQSTWQTILGGDFDDSGTLDADDLQIILDDLGQTGINLIANRDADLDVDADDARRWLEADLGTQIADFNLDHRIDLLDLSILAANFGDTGDYLAGDANFDGQVDLLDLSILATGFGFDAQALPEPSLWWGPSLLLALRHRHQCL